MNAETRGPIGFGDLETGDRVLLDFASHYNEDAQQRAVGTVRKDSDFPRDIKLDTEECGVLVVSWDGGVERFYPPKEDSEYGIRKAANWRGYGGDWEMYRAEEIDFGDLEKSSPVMLEFVSYYNEDARQRATGGVGRLNAEWADLDTDLGYLRVFWDGGVDKQGVYDDHRTGWREYGNEYWLHRLTPVDPGVDDE